MNNMEFTIIPHGYGEGDAGAIFAGYNFGDVNDKYRQRSWMKFPYFSVLIKHPSAGLILYDTGPALAADTTRAPYEKNLSNPLYIERSEFIDERLKSIGLSVNSIDAIILSHCHWDHYGGLMFFSGTKAGKNVYVPKADFAAGLVATHAPSKGYSDIRYYKDDFEIEGIDYCLIEEDCELFPGVEAFLMKGHSSAVMGLVLHLNSGVYIFPSDTVNSALNYGPPVLHPVLRMIRWVSPKVRISCIRCRKNIMLT